MVPYITINLDGGLQTYSCQIINNGGFQTLPETVQVYNSICYSVLQILSS